MASEYQINIHDDKSRKFTIRWSNVYKIDDIFVLLADTQNGSSATYELVDVTDDEGKPLELSNSVNNYILKVYGLRKRNTKSGQELRDVMCFAKIRVKAGVTDKIIFMDLKKYKEDGLPLKLESKGMLPLTVKRKPPSDYRIVVNKSFQLPVQYAVFIYQNRTLTMCFIHCTSLKLPMPFDLPPATWVVCQVFCKGPDNSFTHSDMCEFETFLTKNENSKLYELAIKFRMPTGQRRIKHFYRTKTLEYFDDIMQDKNGIMAPMLKNNGGEQGSVINGNFHGLFFSTFLDVRTNCPQQYSYFGPTRFYVKVEVLFTPNCNLYFVDFYCHYRKHHVAVILTPDSSYRNPFCQQYLKQLDIFDNPFLCLRRSETDDSWVVMANMDVIVEVYYTETVNIKSILENGQGYMEDVDTVGRGYVLPCGIPKNPLCRQCNLKM